MTEFLAEDNVCGQHLLQISAVGNAIIAEILRLKDYIPDIFRLEKKQDQIKYAEVILDFSYFKISEVQDKKIEDDPDLQDLDAEIRENYLEILTRVYLAFESIHQYVTDLKTFLQELNDGMYIQQTLESVLQDDEGKQLMTEALYLYGVMLLVLDLHIPGIVRERLLVSYHRYSAERSHGDSNIDDICMLLRSTGFSNASDAKRIANYPDEYFRRVELDETFIEMIIGRLRSDDVYNQISVYPLPEHRTTALANQAGMLFVCLFFSPRTLHQQNSRMREIVDKFFADNWIVSIYMGITINLIDSWEPYKAARNALLNVTESSNIQDISAKHSRHLGKLIQQSRSLLKEGTLTEKMVIKNISKVVNLIRECNVTLRWLMLHTSKTTYDCSANKKCRQIETQVINDSSYNSVELFELLLNVSQLELKVREIIKEVLVEKENRWNKYRQEAAERVADLSEVFSGTNALMKIEKNQNLKQWFSEINKEITGLMHENPNVSGRKIIQLIQALEEVQEFHNLNANMQVKQHLTETIQYLHQMIQTVNIKEENLINLQFIADLSYAWIIIDKYTVIMQESIKKQPNLVIKLRATFLKLASALEIPLLRINQAHSDDLVSVSQYYSNELVNYVRKVIQIIPKTMFEALAKIIKIQTESIKELPTRLEKDKLREYAQLDERYAVAKYTYSISVFTEGILMMKTTLVGVIELDPKKLLEDGIRQELVKNLTEALHSGLIFNQKVKTSADLVDKLNDLTKIIDGYKRSFEYVQDYINIYGFKIWQEEMFRIINYNVEKECNEFLRKKVQDWQSEYQTVAIPIPTFPPTDTNSVNFIGRLAREILRQTDPKSTVYVDNQTSWYDHKSHKKLLNMNFFSKITDSIGPAGLIGLDKLYSHMITSDLQLLMSTLQKNFLNEKLWIDLLNSLKDELLPTATCVVSQPVKFYNNYTSKFAKVWPKILDWILHIGQKQIIRKHIAYELNSSCKFNSKNLESSLRTMNEALIFELKSHQLNPEEPGPSTDLLCEVNKYLEWAGIYNPYEKVYIKTKNLQNFALFLFLFVIAHTPKLQYIKNTCTLVGRKSEQIDGAAFVIGIVTVLKQFHNDILQLFIEYLGQFVVSAADNNLNAKKELGTEVYTTVHFLFAFIKSAGLSQDILEAHIPEVILYELEYLSNKIIN